MLQLENTYEVWEQPVKYLSLIHISVEVLKIKSVPISLSVSGTPAEGYKYTGYSSEPETVQIYGEKDGQSFHVVTNIYFITKKRKEYDLFTRSRTHVCCEERS